MISNSLNALRVLCACLFSRNAENILEKPRRKGRATVYAHAVLLLSERLYSLLRDVDEIAWELCRRGAVEVIIFSDLVYE